MDEERLFERYLQGEASAQEVAALKALCEYDASAMARLFAQAEREAELYEFFDGGVLAGTQDRKDSRIQRSPALIDHPASAGGSAKSISVRTERQTSIGGSPAQIRLWSAAAILLVVAGSLVFWLIPSSSERPLTRQEERRHRIIVEQLRELDLERKAIETATVESAPPSEPDAFPVNETDLARQKAEAEEAVRFIEARRRFVMQQLRMFRGRGPLPDDLDVDEFDSNAPVATGPALAVGTGPVEVGQVVQVESEQAGTLIREEATGADRIGLRRGMRLLRGDRIETARGKDVPCTSVRLDGGATLDLDHGTTIEVLGRDALRFSAGRVYANIAVPVPGDTDLESSPPFSVQTEAGRLLTHDLQAELYLSPQEILQKDLRARIDGGKVHLVNQKGHVVGRKGQELLARKESQPTRAEGFSEALWRGRSSVFPGLPLDKGSPLLLSDGSTHRCFCAEYALALAHTGEIDLRGIQIVHPSFDPLGEQKDALQATWRAVAARTAALRKTGLRFTPEPVIGTARSLQPPASGRCDDILPERSPAVDQLLSEARRATPERPLVVVTSGSLTDLASAWLIDHGVAERTVVVTDTKTEMWDHDPWAFRIVLTHYRSVSCHLEVPAGTFPSAGLERTRWASIADQTRGLNQDFSRFACVTVAGFVRAVERVRFVCGPPENPRKYRFEPDPKGRIWLVKETDSRRMTQEFEATFLNGTNAR